MLSQANSCFTRLYCVSGHHALERQRLLVQKLSQACRGCSNKAVLLLQPSHLKQSEQALHLHRPDGEMQHPRINTRRAAVVFSLHHSPLSRPRAESQASDHHQRCRLFAPDNQPSWLPCSHLSWHLRCQMWLKRKQLAAVLG